MHTDIIMHIVTRDMYTWDSTYQYMYMYWYVCEPSQVVVLCCLALY